MPIIIPDQRAVPLYEQEKMTIKDKRDYCLDMMKSLQYNMRMRIWNEPIIHEFYAAVFIFYFVLKPKLIDHINKIKDVQPEKAQDYEELMAIMSKYEINSTKMSLEEVRNLLSFLNNFCEEYGIITIHPKFVNQEI